jgi:hypothetical protein
LRCSPASRDRHPAFARALHRITAVLAIAMIPLGPVG